MSYMYIHVHVGYVLNLHVYTRVLHVVNIIFFCLHCSLHKAKLQTIPGSIVVDIVPQPPQSKTRE